jgi:hypothetical protein
MSLLTKNYGGYTDSKVISYTLQKPKKLGYRERERESKVIPEASSYFFKMRNVGSKRTFI